MNRRQKIIISVTGIFLVLLILVGLTYAYFLTQIQGNDEEKSITVSTALLELIYNDGSDGVLTGTNIVPDNNKIIDTKTFTVSSGESTDSINYAVFIENLNYDFVYPTIEYSLTCKNQNNEACNGKTNEAFPTTNDMLVQNTIDPGETHTYTISIKYLDNGENQSDDMNKTFSAKINIYDTDDSYSVIGTVVGAQNGDYVIVESSPKKSQIINGQFKVNGLEPNTHKITLYDKGNTKIAESTFEVTNSSRKIVADRNAKTFDVKNATSWDVPIEGTLVNAIKNDNPSILSAEDDYGTSYYFNGNVDNNYVTYSGKCWKIVRVDGNGNIKIVLDNAYTVCDDDDDATTYSSNPFSASNLGYGLTALDTTDFEYERSSVYQHLNTWKEGLNNIDWLVTSDWCIDTNINRIEEEEYSFQMIKYNYYYGAYNRLVESNPKTPTLKCNMENTSSVNENIGLLSADEIILGGSYLNEGDKYWTFTPAYVRDNGVGCAYVFTYSTNLVTSCTDESNNVRPAVILNSKVLIEAGGNGKLETPYVVNGLLD